MGVAIRVGKREMIESDLSLAVILNDGVFRVVYLFIFIQEVIDPF